MKQYKKRYLNQTLQNNDSFNTTLSRKQLRKKLKIQKKQKKIQYFNKSHIKYSKINNQKNYQQQGYQKSKQQEDIYQINDRQNQQQLIDEEKQIKKTKKIKKSKTKKQQNYSQKLIKTEQQVEDDRLIQMYEKKLSNQKGKKKKIKLSEDGLDDDLFDFLDNISKKVKKNGIQQKKIKKIKNKKNIQKIEEKIEEQQPQWQQGGFQELQNVNMDEQNNINSQKIQLHKNQLLDNNAQYNQKKQKVKKSLNSLLNKVSDGNLTKIFKDVHQIFNSYPKVIVYDIFSSLFIKFNIQTMKVLVHIFATHIALSCALHHLFDNNFLAILMKQLIQKYEQLNSLNQQQFLQGQIDFNPLLQKKKNITNTFCYLYMFDSLTVDFIKQFIISLLKNINPSSIQLLYLIIQNVGSKIRADDPKILKDLITEVKSVIDQFKQSTLKGNKKAQFILQQLNQIKFNRKSILDPDQRMAFLKTFINKNIIEQNGLSKKIFTLGFDSLSKIDKSKNFWWEPNSTMYQNQKNLDRKQQELEQLDNQLRSKKKYYQQLAKQQKMVTQQRKKIFITIITAQDYIDAAQKLIQLKIKKKNQLAAVLVETSSQQSIFNMYYVYLANKLIEIFRKFKLAIQFAVWDQQKQLQNYTLRKISNLAKFLSRLIIMNDQCSLSMLKNLNDLGNLNQHEQIFLLIFLEDFYTEVTLPRLNELVRKIREGDNNQMFKNVFKQYLQQQYLAYVKDNNKNYKDKIKLTLRLLNV